MGEMSLRLRVLIGIAVVCALVTAWRYLFYTGDVDPDIGAAKSRVLKLERDGDVDALAEVVAGKNVPVACFALAALGRLGTDAAVDHIVTATNDNRPKVRGAAASSYANARAKRDAAPLSRLARDDEDAGVRATAVAAIGRMYAYDEMETLLSVMANDASVTTCRNAAEAAAAIIGRRYQYTPEGDRGTRARQVAIITDMWKREKGTVGRYHEHKHHK